MPGVMFTMTLDCKDGRHDSCAKVKPKRHDRRLMADCSNAHEPHLLYVSGWDI